MALTLGVEAHGDTTSATDDYEPAMTGCNFTATGPDVVYRFTPQQSGDYVFSLVPDSQWDPILYVTTACVDVSTACLAGADDHADGAPESVAVTLVAGTTYLVGADGYDGASGAFRLSVNLSQPLPYDTCEGALPLLVGVPVAGDTTLAADDYQPACGGSDPGGADVVYAFTAPATHRYRFTLTPEPGFDPVLELFTACTASAQACLEGADQGARGDPEVLTESLTAGETLYVVADGYSRQVGRFTLEVEDVGVPPGNDVCAAPVVLAGHDATAASQVISIDTRSAQHDFGATCAGDWADVVFALDLTAPVSLQASLTDADGGAVGALSLTATCANPADEVACSDTGLAVDRLGGVTGGTYFLWVELPASSDPATLTVGLGAAASPTLPGDTCDAPLALHESTTTVGDTTGFADDMHPGGTDCHAAAAHGPDVFYALQPTASGTYRVTATPTGPWDLVLYVLDQCPAAGGAVAACTGGADLGFTGVAETVTFEAVAGQTVLVGVDGTAANAGAFSLEAEPVLTPLGERCAALDRPDGGTSAIVLTALADGGRYGQATVDTRLYADDSRSAPGGQCGGGYGPDAVFRLTLGLPVTSLTATASGLGSDGGQSRPMVYLRQGPCLDLADTTGAGAELACDHPEDGGTARFTTGPLPAGDYFLWVDSFQGDQGNTLLEVTAP